LAKAANYLTAGNLVCLLLYVAMIAGIVAGFYRARTWAQDTYLTEAEHKNWNKWRDDAKQQAEGDGPVKRRPPKSTAPPALVLTQDYFPQFLTIALILSTALFFTMTFMVRGALRSPGQVYEDV